MSDNKVDKTCPFIMDITLDFDDYQDGAFEILHYVRPCWKRENVKIKVFTNGITNKMLGFHQIGNDSDTVLIRINGNKTEIFLDRENEVKSFKTLHQAGRAPNLYCIFKNGLCYEYIHGDTVSKEEVRAPEVFRLDGYDGPGEITLRKELRALEGHLSKLGSPLVYCHNDLLLNNVIYNKEKNSAHFIDYEYTGMNYQAFDIGNHFCEFAGVDEVDYSLYPDRELQFAWLRQYLKYWKEGTGKEVTDHDVEKLYVQVNKFALAANFMWGTWALVQAKYSSIDFDYLKYAKERLGEYFRRKDEFLGLQMPELACCDNNAA